MARPFFAVMSRYEGERSAMADRLVERLNAHLVIDPRRDLPPSAAGTWRTARLAWTCWQEPDDFHFNEPWTHVVVVQDDAVLVHDFAARAATALAARPYAVVTFFSRHRNVEQAAREGLPFARIPAGDFLMAQAVALPISWTGAMVAWADRLDAGLGDDARLKRWCVHTGADVWATVPSLVDHAPVRSVIGPRSTKRQARLFAGDSE